MLLTRLPRPALRPFVKSLWASGSEMHPAIDATREHVLPTGDMHIVFRLTDHPLRVYDDAADAYGRTIDRAIVGGARATFYLRQVGEPTRSIGAQLCGSASSLLFGVPANELAGRHTPLADLWGRFAELTREELCEARSPAQQVDTLERILAARLPLIRGLHPALAQAIECFQTTPDVRAAVKATGYSHRRFVELFEGGIGLTPKVFCRVLRFRRTLVEVTTGASLADLAFAGGYSDQSHFNREFRAFAGMTPGEYRRAAPGFPHHVPVR